MHTHRNRIPAFFTAASILVLLAGCASGTHAGAGAFNSPHGVPAFNSISNSTSSVNEPQNGGAASASAFQGQTQTARTDPTFDHSEGFSNPNTAPRAGTPAWVSTAAADALARGGATASFNSAGGEGFNQGPGFGYEPDATLVDALEGLTPATFAVEGADFDPRLTPDGKFLVFSSTQHRATSDIYFKPVGSRTMTQLTADPASDVMPAVSPDGQRIAFCSNRNGSWQIFLMGIRGGRAVQLTADSANDLHPSWSPDGKRLAFCRLGEVSGRWEMWVIGVDQPASAEFIGYGMFPEWCPTTATGFGGADRILFQRGRERGDRAFGLWTIDYKPGDASTPTEVVRSERGFAAINPAWSPDGQWIAYATVPVTDSNNSGKPRNADLWITGVDGAGKVNLTSGRFANLMPCWGKDGRIYFVSNRTGTDAIWSVGTERALAAIKGGPAEAKPVTGVPAETKPIATVPTEKHE